MIVSTEFETIEVNESDIIYFENGIYGFESIKEYVLLKEDDLDNIMCMQSVHSKIPSFILIDPYVVMQEYNPILNESDLQYFNVPSIKNLRFLLITVIKEEQSQTVVNLKSPITIDTKTKRAKQVILENNDYPIRYPLFHSDML